MKITYLLLSLFLFAGCGAQKLAVDHADSLLSHQITKRLPLYSQQKEELSKDIDKLLEETKPIAQDLLPVIEKMEVDQSKVASQYKVIEGFYMKLADKFSKIVSKYMGKLDTKQQKDFYDNLEDENRSMAKKDKDDIVDDVQDKLEHFLGPLTGPQKQILADYSSYYFEKNKARVLHRKKLQQDMKPIFESDLSPESKASTFHEMFTKYQQENQKGNKNVEILEKMVPTFTKIQKEHLRKEIQNLKELLNYFMTVDY